MNDKTLLFSNKETGENIEITVYSDNEIDIIIQEVHVEEGKIITNLFHLNKNDTKILLNFLQCNIEN